MWENFRFFFLKIQVWLHLALHSVLEMRQFTVVSFCLLFYPTFLVTAEKSEFQKIHFAALRCNASEKFIYKNYSCFSKSYSRTFSTINIIGTTKFPLHNIFVRNWKVHEQKIFTKFSSRPNFTSSMDWFTERLLKPPELTSVTWPKNFKTTKIPRTELSTHSLSFWKTATQRQFTSVLTKYAWALDIWNFC